jgi:hypothetical protein
LGCYSFQPLTVSEYKQVEEKEGKPHNIHVITKDDQEYHFSGSDFTFENDTLYGKEIRKNYDGYGKTQSKEEFDRIIALSEIESISVKSYDSKGTIKFLVISTVLVAIFIAEALPWIKSAVED